LALASFDLVSLDWQKYRRAYHASTRDLGDIASRAKPRLLTIVAMPVATTPTPRLSRVRE